IKERRTSRGPTFSHNSANGKTSMTGLKPIHYNLIFYFGSFEDDCAGFESSTPFIPLSVGDFVDHRMSSSIMAPSNKLRKDEAFQVTAVRHSFQEFDTHISQYVHVCVEVAKFHAQDAHA